MQPSYELSKDPALLDQYYALRERCYQRELGLPDFDGSETQDDLQSDILLIRDGQRCLGGARILPGWHNEAAFAALQKLMPKLGLELGSFCFWERLSVCQAYRRYEGRKDFCAQLVNATWELGYDYAFMVSSKRNARLYRQCHAAWGLKFNLLQDVDCAPEDDFSNLEHVLSVAHLQPVAMNPCSINAGVNPSMHSKTENLASASSLLSAAA